MGGSFVGGDAASIHVPDRKDPLELARWRGNSDTTFDGAGVKPTEGNRKNNLLTLLNCIYFIKSNN